ncbi:hypothetical protein SAMN05216167_112160 [Spirosoma endophyticum]|uniref:Uncharacterized protein n=1 Tax=Spirosoma endophyticum TaxID=662367 RepID=A0A1I1ZMB2_9BACT|nr:hypothetical protein SAMN05216167_112160 [Spirosoma endophyticum]
MGYILFLREAYLSKNGQANGQKRTVFQSLLKHPFLEAYV